MSDEPRREDDRLAAHTVARTEQKLDDFIAESRKWMEQHDLSARDWRISIEAEIKLLKDFYQRVDTPLKVMGWAFVAVFSAMLAAVGSKLFHWFDR